MKKVFGLMAALSATAVLASCPSAGPSAVIRHLGHRQSAGPVAGASSSSGSADPSGWLRPFDVAGEFALPPPHDAGPDPAGQIARGTQVFQRTQLLHIDSGTADAAWATVADTETRDRTILPALLQEPLRKVSFSGTKLSQLGALIATAGPAHITVLSRTLQADTALTITGDHVVVDFSGAAIQAGPNPPPWLVRIVHVRNVAMIGAKLTGGTNGFLVDSGSNIDLEGNDVEDLAENGIVVTGPSSNLDIHANHLHGLGRAGIMLDGPVRAGLLHDNQIDHLLGHSNWNAGILLTSRGGDIAADPNTFFLPDDYWVVPQPLVDRLRNPDQNVIMDNTIRDGLSSGIYDDGAIANIFLDNRIEGNSKEGICFDNGATSNVFAGNLVAGNGRRWGQRDSDLALDSVLWAGLDADGMSRAKLPGISIDNAMYNEIYANDVMRNFGGGIKMVRTGLFNAVAENAIIDNNLGQSSDFHFFGIELGDAPADQPAIDLNFVGSSGNVIVGNAILGRHYSGIFFSAGSVQNELIDNRISGVAAFKLEAPSQATGLRAALSSRPGPR